MESYYNGGAIEQKGAGDHFAVDDLLDFSNDDAVLMPDNNSFFVSATAATTDDSATFASNESCNSSTSGGIAYHSLAHNSHFSNELLVPNDDIAELEWLSNFVEDSFSTKQNLQITNLHILPGYSKPTTPESSSVTHPNSMNQNSFNPIFHSDIPLPGKARSKRTRVAPCDWSKHLVAPTTETPSRRQDSSNSDGTVRKCQHCAAEKTPQWRTGPMGPKTLCNACGVRYKSGRLVPEYRPAASPTFVATKHSNSHRKVMEIRRQKEFHHRAAHQQQFINQSSMFGDDYLIHQHNGPNFRHMI